MRKAVVDLGTNTFHLLILDIGKDKKLSEIYRLRRYVFLGESGLHIISEASFDRGIAVLTEFKKLIDQFHVEVVKAIGTAALRNASNATEFCTAAYQAGFEVEVVDGLQEANYIFKGVGLLSGSNVGTDLIMDIGGGSVEFILVREAKLHWAKSFQVGLSILKAIHNSDPMSKTDKDEIRIFLQKELADLLDNCKHLQIDRLIGASGTFEIIHQMMNPDNNLLFAKIERRRVETFMDAVAAMTKAQIISDTDIPQKRALYMPVAIQLIKFILSQFEIEDIYYSKYAMKEGIAVT